MASLCGSNVFLIGDQSQPERIMIDAGDVTERNAGFLINLNSYLEIHKGFISQILITHGHHDHFGGLNDVCKLLKKRGQI